MRAVTLIRLLSHLAILMPLVAFSQPVLYYLGPLDGTFDPSAYSTGLGEFAVGNRLPVAGFATSDYWDGFPFYPNYFIVPFCPELDMEVPCSDGWRIDAVHFVFACLAPGALTINMRFDLAEGCPIPDPTGMCGGLVTPWTPGVEPLTTGVSVPGEGIYELVVPASGWECLHTDFWYGISHTEDILGDMTGNLFRYAIAPTRSVECPSLRSYTMGERVIIAASEMSGDLVMWVDASCCGVPVPVQAETWGDVKSLYR